GRSRPRPGPRRRRPSAGWPGRRAGPARRRRGGARWPTASPRARRPAAGPRPGRGSGHAARAGCRGGHRPARSARGRPRRSRRPPPPRRAARAAARAGRGSGPAPTWDSSRASTAGTIDATVALIGSGPRTFGPVNYIRTKAEARASHPQATATGGYTTDHRSTRWSAPCAAIFVWAQPNEEGCCISVEPRINDRIRTPQVRVVGAAGEQLGVMDPQAALRMASQQDLDTVEGAPMARPPVVKLTEHSKVQY